MVWDLHKLQCFWVGIGKTMWVKCHSSWNVWSVGLHENGGNADTVKEDDMGLEDTEKHE